MSRCVFSPLARDDLRGLRAYIARDNAVAADRVLDQAESRCRFLADYPDLGERCEELDTALRRFTVGSYVIYYRPRETGLEVVRVLSGARDSRRPLLSRRGRRGRMLAFIPRSLRRATVASPRLHAVRIARLIHIAPTTSFAMSIGEMFSVLCCGKWYSRTVVLSEAKNLVLPDPSLRSG